MVKNRNQWTPCGLACVGLLLSLAAGQSAPRGRISGQNSPKSSPALPLARLEQAARRAQKLGHWQQAAARYRRLTRLAPHSLPVWGNYGNVLKHLHRYHQAARALQRAQALAPRVPAVALDLALVYIAAGRYARAVAPLKAGLRLTPGNPRMLQLLGISQLNSGRYAAAVRSLTAARERQPRSSLSLLYALAAAETMARRPRAARRTLRSMLRLDRQLPTLHLLLGEALLNQGRVHAAQAQFHQALALNPRLAEAQLQLGLSWLEQRRLRRALRHFQLASRLDPECVNCAYEAGSSEYLLHADPTAARDLRRSIALGGRHLKTREPHAATVSNAWFYLAQLAQRRHQPAAALADFRSAIRLAPNQPAPHYLYGRALAAQGHMAAAQRQFRIFQHLRAQSHARADRVLRRSFRRALQKYGH